MGKKRIIAKSEEDVLKEEAKTEAALKKEVKVTKRIEEAKVYISSSYNNTILSLTDLEGNVLAWVSAGNIGFKGTKKGTPFAATKVAEVLVQRAEKLGVAKVKVFIKGIGSGRESALRCLAVKGLSISSIKDITPIPHNGCRPKKARRV